MQCPGELPVSLLEKQARISVSHGLLNKIRPLSFGNAGAIWRWAGARRGCCISCSGERRRGREGNEEVSQFMARTSSAFSKCYITADYVPTKE